ncbi:hypothetical protein [Shimia sp.]|uniref:hypothetical protein n=1 Tax=Shimia sp. TaxID=1954381 RepID=UPI003BAB54EC
MEKQHTEIFVLTDDSEGSSQVKGVYRSADAARKAAVEIATIEGGDVESAKGWLVESFFLAD